MAAAILSQDILAICLIVAKGNIHLSLEEIIRRVENFQEVHNRHFGISRSDFRGLFNMLLSWELRIKSFFDEIDDIKLIDIIPDIIKYHDAYFNDEGEHWAKDDNYFLDEKINYSFIEHWFGYDHNKYLEKLEINQKCKMFFDYHKIATVPSDVVKEFMEEMKITDDILYSCSRHGDSS